MFQNRVGQRYVRELERPLPPYFTLADTSKLALGQMADWFDGEVYGYVGECDTRLYRLVQDMKDHARYEEL